MFMFLLANQLMEDWFESFVGSLGKLWRLHRRRLTPDIRDAFAQLLLEVRVEYLPTDYLDTQSNIARARYDVRGITELLKQIASRQGQPLAGASGVQTNSKDNVRKVLLLDELVERSSPTTVQDAGSASLASSTCASNFVGTWVPIPLRGTRVDEERGNEVRALKKDISDLQVHIQRVTDSHQSEISGLQGKLKDCAHLIVDAQNQLESNTRAMLDNIRQISASGREAQSSSMPGETHHPSELPTHQPRI